MRVGWLQDDHGYFGGAEMTAAEFRAAAPEHVVIVDCPSGDEVFPSCEVYLVHNAVQYSAEQLERNLAGVRVIKYAHDLFLHDFHGSREWLAQHAEWIFCSPGQRDQMLNRLGVSGEVVPPALNLVKPSRQVRRNGERKGTVSIAQWRNPGKGARQLAEWALANGPVDVYGPGDFAPGGSGVIHHGEIDPQVVPTTLMGYERFAFLPVDYEPFCRTAVEAYYAGCELVINDLIGARYYLEEDPAALETAAADLWSRVMA